jgi:sigma-B regulation protein RsbU (phosphoserine phosphatase)
MGWIFAAFLLAALAALWLATRRKLRSSRAESAQLGGEIKMQSAREVRLFEFLHSLGEATLTLEREQDATMHRLIASGAAQVIGAQGGALYLLDSAGKALVPRGFSKECPPLVSLPERILGQERANPGKLSSFLRLHSIPTNGGALGEVFTAQQAANIPDLRKHAAFGGTNNPHQQQLATLIAPLTYGTRKLGVLAVATEKAAQPFTDDAMAVMRTLAEQCAFALGNRQAHHEVREKDQLEGELRNASEIQRILLPEKAPEMPGFVLAGKNIPARHVSGDYFDYFPVGDAHIGVVIADVSGKGIPAALITAMCRSVLRANARDTLSPAAVLAAVNRNLFPDIRQDMFITMIYAVLARDGSTVTLARAGHTDPCVWRNKTGEVEVITAPGIAVGIDKGEVFERGTRDVSISMEAGDCLLFYTDGVNEAEDHKGLLFGEERLKDVLRKTVPDGASSVVEGIPVAVEAFLGGVAQQDDITLVAVKKRS